MRPRIHLRACLLACALGFVTPLAAHADPAQFEVIVLRGASVSRVTGTPGGEIREEVLHEDPRPAQPAPEPTPRVREKDEPERTIVVVASVPALRYPLWLRGHRAGSHERLRDHGHRPPKARPRARRGQHPIAAYIRRTPRYRPHRR